MHFYNAQANYQTLPNFHDYMEIFFIYEGQGVFQFDNRRYEFNKGDVFVVGSHEIHNCSRCFDDHTKTIELYFMPELIFNPGSNHEDFYYLMPFYNHDDQFVHRMPSGSVDVERFLRQIGLIVQELRNENTFFRLAVRNHVRDLLLILSRYYERSLNNYNCRLSNVKRLVAVAKYVKDNYQEHLSLSAVAGEVFMSREPFCRFFKQATGSTLTDYLNRFRIARARDLLEQDEMPITHIAFEVGFENYSYFERVFRKLMLLSPTEYRNGYAKPFLHERGHRELLARLIQ